MSTPLDKQLPQPGDADLSFANSGVFSLSNASLPPDLEGARLINGLALQPDGKIVVGAGLYHANDERYVYALIRLNTDGSLDTQFADEGVRFGNFLNGYSAGGGKISVLPDGKILMLGWTLSESTGWASLVVARFLPNGDIDEEFGEQGRRIIENGEKSKFVSTSETLQIDTDGKLFVTANYVNPDASDHYSASIFSFLPNGLLNGNFNGTGRLDFRADNSGPYTVIGSCLLQGNKLLIAGDALLQGLSTAYVARLHPDGILDQTFGDVQTRGLYTIRVDNQDSRFNDLSHKADGSLACFGQIGTDSETGAQGLLVMLTPNGSPHQMFNEGKPLLTRLSDSDGTRWRCGYAQSDGSLVALSGDNEMYLARFLPEGVPDREFGNSGHVVLPDLRKLPPCQLIKRPDNRVLLSFNFSHLDSLGLIHSYIG
jgi:uncharacterized delta-60 repeat protein